jgi:hypothetical protein
VQFVDTELAQELHHDFYYLLGDATDVASRSVEPSRSVRAHERRAPIRVVFAQSAIGTGFTQNRVGSIRLESHRHPSSSFSYCCNRRRNLVRDAPFRLRTGRRTRPRVMSSSA